MFCNITYLQLDMGFKKNKSNDPSTFGRTKSMYPRNAEKKRRGPEHPACFVSSLS